MKLWAPKGVTSVSHDGEALEVAADGSVEVSGALGALLVEAHGFTDEKPRKKGGRPALDGDAGNDEA